MSHYDCKRCGQQPDKCDCSPLKGSDMNQSQLESVRAARLQLLDMGDEKTAKLLDWAVTADPGRDYLKAAIDCPHEITMNQIVLHYDGSKPGRNALNQLGLRLEDAGKES